MTPKQTRFVAEYLVTRNGAEAARRAGYSERTARQMASENLTKPDIQAALAKKETELAEKMDLSRGRVVGELRATVEVARSQGNAGAMITGWVQIAKIAGLYAPEPVKVILSSENERLRAKFEALSDEQLMAIVGGTPQIQCAARAKD